MLPMQRAAFRIPALPPTASRFTFTAAEGLTANGAESGGLKEWDI